MGVKAEQSLRDAVRTAVEEREGDHEGLELVPVGRKDWVAGKRVGVSMLFSDLEGVGREVMTALIAMESHQRIRRENVRLYVVPPPVPVFKDPPGTLADGSPQDEFGTPDEPIEEEPVSEGLGGPTVCPVCKREVHSFNLQHDTKGRVVGCFICGGDPGLARS